MTAPYLEGLSAVRANMLRRANATGLLALKTYLDAGKAVAFLGAGASMPLYPFDGCGRQR
jgi:hypothetical protein